MSELKERRPGLWATDEVWEMIVKQAESQKDEENLKSFSGIPITYRDGETRVLL